MKYNNKSVRVEASSTSNNYSAKSANYKNDHKYNYDSKNNYNYKRSWTNSNNNNNKHPMITLWEYYKAQQIQW